MATANDALGGLPMKVLVMPEDAGYQGWVKQLLEDAGCEVSACGMKRALLDKNVLHDSDAVLVNFLDLMGRTNALKKPIATAARAALAVRLYRSPAKFVYVMHNIYHHEGSDKRRDFFIRRMFAKRSDAIVMLSEKGKEVLKSQMDEAEYGEIANKITLIPIPNYMGRYTSSGRDFRAELGIDPDEFVFSFIGGSLRPYKNIESVIELARAFEGRGLKARFLISGVALNEEDRSRYERLCDSVSNIIFIQGLIPEEDMFDFVTAGNALLCPFDASTLDSSTCVMAFSCGRNVVAPAIGTIDEVPEGLTYSYRRDDGQDEAELLENAALCAYEEFSSNRKLFDEKQDALLEYATTAWSEDIVKCKYKELLDGLTAACS